MPESISPIIDSLGWALLHSLWQIAALAAIVAVALRFVPRANPQLRFSIAYFGMVGALLAFIVTFFVGLKPPAEMQAALIAAPADGDAVAAFLAMLGRSTGFVSFAWALGFGWLGTRYVRALGATRALRREGISAVPELWQQRFRLWVDRLGADSGTTILQSNRISTPITIGVLRPMVLVPAGFFLRLPTEQAEAILVHEIAHICRQDYLLGLFQAMIANVFFFHPAVYYLSRQIDIEREYACDDRAASETGRAGALAAGLSRIALDREAQTLGFAMAANGRRMPIMDRINRLGGRPVAGDSEAGVPAAALVMVFAASMMIAIGAEASNGSVPGSSGSHPAMNDDAKSTPVAEVAAALQAEPANWSDASFEPAAAPSAAPVARPATVARVAKPSRVEPHAAASRHAQRIVARSVPLDRVLPVANAAKTMQIGFLATVARNAGFQPAVAWDVHSDSSEADCERAERIREQAERAGERAAEIAEHQAAIAERYAERIEREMERRADMYSAAAEARADQLEAQIEAQTERREAMLERQAEMRERQADQRERDAERRMRLTISFNTVPPTAPVAPAAPVVQIAFMTTDTL